MLEVDNKLDWCWFCDLTCQFVYDESLGNWCCTRCGRELARRHRTVEELLQEKDGFTEKGVLKSYQRRHPRFVVDLPFCCFHLDREGECTGVATNASEGGLLVYLRELIPKGVALKIAIRSVNGAEYNTIMGVARVVWGDLAAKIDRGKYRYGLKFESLSKESLGAFNSLLEEVAKTQAG